MSNRTRLVCAALAFALLAASLTLAGCGGGGSSTPNQLCDQNGNNCLDQYTSYCPYPSGFAPQLVYPIPEATDVPDNISEIVVADAPGAAYEGNTFFYQFYLSTISSAFALASQNGGPEDKITSAIESLPSNQVPSPSATSTIANPEYEYGTILYGPLAPATQFYVYVADTAQSGPNEFCAMSGPIAAFTTSAGSSTSSLKSTSHPPMPARELLRLRS